MGVATGVVIGVASRTPTNQNSWIRPCVRRPISHGYVPLFFSHYSPLSSKLDLIVWVL